MLALAPRRQQRKPALGITTWIISGCKGTKKNRNEKKSKSEISKKIVRPKGGRWGSLREPCAQEPQVLLIVLSFEPTQPT
ncbi:hypothetical protein DW830_04210 [Prevotella sp. AM34-19LB]|nr:hypothetical protein DW830_04210 [Prevotella sp. AM34-19LB]